MFLQIKFTNIYIYIYIYIVCDVFFLLACFAFIVTGQIRIDRQQRERRERTGSGKVLESGFQHGRQRSATAWRYISACCPQGYRHRLDHMFKVLCKLLTLSV